MHPPRVQLPDDAHHAPRRGAEQVIAEPQARLRSEVRERIQDHEALDALGMRHRVAEGQRAAERFAEQRHAAAAGGDALDLGVQIGDEIVHRAGLVPEARGRDGEVPLERGDLAIEQLAGAVDPGHQNEMVFHC